MSTVTRLDHGYRLKLRRIDHKGRAVFTQEQTGAQLKVDHADFCTLGRPEYMFVIVEPEEVKP